jgi:GNAT superfamily N-acetyltransferase
VRARDLNIRPAVTAADMAHARALFEEYARWLAIDLSFQNFADELAGLPGAYAPPRGRLLLAGDEPAGCIALRPRDDAFAGEVKRLYVRPAARGGGLGEALVDALLGEARAIGYRELYLDTLRTMDDALRLYRRKGFAECAPYYHNPHPGVVYLRAALC